ncbi:MAG: fibronectin type III domain-containing protein, partial [Opitutaceae bacterium]|nr:fibronectin type III domain-containing protein [Opitutaceae bacterium]
MRTTIGKTLLLSGQLVCSFVFADTLLLEPEQFDMVGGWRKESNYIAARNTGGSALGGFAITTAGTHNVWACAMDFETNQPGVRRYEVRVDDENPLNECGKHGHEGWYWELADTRLLAGGTHALLVKDTTRNYGRLEAVLVASDLGLDPNAVSRASLNTYRRDPVQPVRVPAPATGLEELTVTAGDAGVAAALENQDMILRFRHAETAGGKTVLVREIVFKHPDRPASAWQSKLEPLYLISSETSSVDFSYYLPTWRSEGAMEDCELAGRIWTLPADESAAFSAGHFRTLFLPVSVRPLAGETSVEVTYEAESPAGGAPATARAVWQLPEQGFAARMAVSLAPTAAGWYSLGFAAGGIGGFPSGQITALQLPPLFQFRRAPALSVMLTSAVTPHPLALVETNDGQKITHGVVADPGAIPAEWPQRDTAPFGFALRGAERAVQPVVFSPILGGRGSQIAAGAGLSAAWWVVAAPQTWENAMRAIDTDIMKLRDYREPWTSSLTKQALNIIDLIKSGQEFTWYENLKGPSNIEDPDTATQAAPLMLLSAARLTHDAEFYKKRSLPSLEYMLSRPRVHYALDVHEYVSQESWTRLDFKQAGFGAALWQGAGQLLGGLNPWLGDYMMNGNQIRTSGGVPGWSEKMAFYRKAPTPELLAEIENEALAWAETEFVTKPALPENQSTVSIASFYNFNFYPYWWDLVDLYELTGSPALLAYAEKGAALTAAGQWVQPVVPAGDITLYPGGTFTTSRTIGWNGSEGRRVGWTGEKVAGQRVTKTFGLPEKNVPAWLTAPAGLGLEAPTTYFVLPDLANMQLTAWAANLLRLSAAGTGAGNDYWRAGARNAVIGRGANYPGYYLSNQIDLQHDPDYPNAGPDVTAFYWHHAPVHLAMLVDYLVTDAEVRTGGQIRFPYAKSQGYVWFSSRVYGGAPGRVFDDRECWLWLDREKFGVDTPKVDYFGALGAGRFHLVLLNQAQGAVSAQAFVDTAALGIAPDSVVSLRTGAGVESVSIGAGGLIPVNFDKNGWAILTFDSNLATPWPAHPPLTASPVKHAIDTEWGELNAFRIRSPHGFDSLYTGLTGAPDGGTITLLRGESETQVATKTDVPYEISLHDISMGEPLKFKLRLSRSGAPDITTEMITMEGTIPAAPWDLSATGENSGGIRLAWTPVPGAQSYVIKRADSSDAPFQEIAADVTGPFYIDVELVQNKTYRYMISARNTYGISPDSGIVSASAINDAAPRITAHPVAPANPEYGADVTLSISVENGGGL